MKRALFAAICAVAFMAVGATAALAGEVKGSAGHPVRGGDEQSDLRSQYQRRRELSTTRARPAPPVSSNDMDPEAGQTVSQVQTAADSWKYYGLPKGAPGTLGLCRGGTGER